MNIILNKVMMVIQYLRNKNIPFYKKMIIVGCLIYIFYPMDLVPDYIIGMGILDDLVSLALILLTMRSEMGESNKNKGYLDAEKSRKMFEGKKRKGR